MGLKQNSPADFRFILVVAVTTTFGLSGCSAKEHRALEQKRVSTVEARQSTESDSETKLKMGENKAKAVSMKGKDLRTQERIALSMHYTKTGQRHYENYRYREAREDLQKAVELDPDNANAKQLLEMSGLILGERRESLASSANRLANERQVRLQQERIELRRLYKAGLKLQEAKDYSGAIRKFEQVLERIKWSPLTIDTDGLENKARANLIKGRSLSRSAMIKRRDELEIRALRSARNEERSARSVRSRKVSLLLQRATDQLRLRQFSKAERTVLEVLRIDRRNHTALRLREVVVSRRHRDRRSKIAARNREETRRNNENAKEVGVPYIGGQ